MRSARVRLGSWLLSLGMGIGIAPTAIAGTMYLQGASLQIRLGDLAPVEAQWDGTGSADVDFLGGSNIQVISGLSSGILGFRQTLDLPASGLPVQQLLLSGANGVGSFINLDTPAGNGQMAILGGATLCLLACDDGASASSFTATLSDGANGWGLGGEIASGGEPVFPLLVTIQGSSWTTGAINVGSGGASGTAAFGGAVTLVSALDLQWRTTDPNATVVDLPGYASMTLVFAPEPGTLLLACAGLAALGAHQRKRIAA